MYPHIFLSLPKNLNLTGMQVCFGLLYLCISPLIQNYLVQRNKPFYQKLAVFIGIPAIMLYPIEFLWPAYKSALWLGFTISLLMVIGISVYSYCISLLISIGISVYSYCMKIHRDLKQSIVFITIMVPIMLFSVLLFFDAWSEFRSLIRGYAILLCSGILFFMLYINLDLVLTRKKNHDLWHFSWNLLGAVFLAQFIIVFIDQSIEAPVVEKQRQRIINLLGISGIDINRININGIDNKELKDIIKRMKKRELKN